MCGGGEALDEPEVEDGGEFGEEEGGEEVVLGGAGGGVVEDGADLVVLGAVLGRC